MHFVTHFFQAVVRWLLPPLCWHCQTEGAWLCPKGQAVLDLEPLWTETLTLPGINHIWIRGSYDCLVLQQFIKKLKYSDWTNLQEALPLLLEPLTNALPEFPPDTVLIPVPLHRHRQRFRGFNQSEMIAQALQQLLGLPINPLLERQRHTTAQAKLSEAERLTNVKDAFCIRPGVDKIPNAGILIDDVLTTGSTLTECSQVLRKGGMKKIYAITLAKG